MQNGQNSNRDVDQLTGLYTKTVFFRKAEELLKTHPDRDFYLIALDIEHFKLFNDWYGYENGDRLLKSIGRHMKDRERTCLCVSGYMGGDDFVMMVEKDENLLNRMSRMFLEYPQQYGQDLGFLPAFGVYAVENRDLPITVMYDRAVIAVESVKGNYACRIGRYEPSMKEKLEEGQVLLRDIRRALQHEELTFYLQPICNMHSRKIAGLESLIRWNHPKRGLISPSKFIPILEENGFVTKVDLYMWEKACGALSSWISRGYKPVPMSVNVSRMDFYALDLPEVFKDLAGRYRIPPQLLEIEITESAYMEDYDRISEVIQRLRSYGFLVFMDDFGSGYSSLNMLRDIKVDALKVDTKFLDIKPGGMDQGINILEAIVNLAGFMNLKLIAEGVETPGQEGFLREIGCVYAQGYYYYRPMPRQEAERILKNEENLDFGKTEKKGIKRLSVSELCSRNVISERMLNNMLGGVGFFDLYKGKLELLRVNEQYFQVIGLDPAEAEALKEYAINSIFVEDLPKLMKACAEAVKNRNNGARQTVRCQTRKSGIIWLFVRIFFLREQDGHQLFYASLRNITEEKRKETALEASQKSLQALLGMTGYNESFLQMTEENRKIATTIFSQMTPCGMIGGYCEPDFPLYFANEEMVKLLGYASYQDMVTGIDGKLTNIVYAEDRSIVSEHLDDLCREGKEYTTKYRSVRKDGSTFWTQNMGRVVQAEDGRLAVVGACTDISEFVEAQEKLLQLNRKLQEQNAELSYLTSDQPGGYHRCAHTPDLTFTYISDRFTEMLGYSRAQIRELFEDKFVRMIHPDDRDLVLRSAKGGHPGDIFNLEFRILGADGYIWVADQAKMVAANGTASFYGVLLDITNTVRIKEQIEQMSIQNRRIVDNILEKSTYSLKANLTRNEIVMDKGSQNWLDDNGYEKNASFSHMVEAAIESAVLPEYKMKIREFLDRSSLLSLYEKGIQSQAVEYRRFYKGKICWMQMIYHLMHLDETEDLYLYLYTVDIDEKKKKEIELRQRAELDELTGLYNRQTALPRIQEYLSKIENETAAVIMFDLDKFKNINDRMGHVYGDKVLSETSEGLRNYFSQEDIVCRIGGDEFLVLCKHTAEDTLKATLKKITEELVNVYYFEGKPCTCSVSAGYVLAPAHGRDFQELYKKADTALFDSKKAGRKRFRAYSEKNEREL